MNRLNYYIESHKERFLEELFTFLRIPSISAISAHKKDTEHAATYVRDQLEKAGADVAYLIPTEGHPPLVYAEKKIDVALPTVLVYGHYDVQPADPAHLWETPAFEPTIREGRIYARGASDDKGQIYLHFKALEAMLATGTLPCNLKFIIEGEEEVGSSYISEFLQKKEQQELLKADIVLVSDTTLGSAIQPTIAVSLRGICAFEVTLQGPSLDLHSGVYGGSIANPIEMLSKMVSQLKDKNGRITIPHFYEDVLELTKAERTEINTLPFDEKAYKKKSGVDALQGETGYTTYERVGIRPSLDYNGIYGGYTGEGSKTIIPSKAHAKFTIRTVANQDSKKIAHHLTKYLHQITPPGTQLSIQTSHLDNSPLQVPLHALGLKAASKAFETVWGKQPKWVHEGGSIPILGSFQKILNADVIMLGFGLNNDNIHSPNESFKVDHFFKGIETVAAFYRSLATLYANEK